MITNELLREKWRTQELLAKEAGGDVKKYSKHIHNLFEKMVRERKMKVKYAKRKPQSVDVLR